MLSRKSLFLTIATFGMLTLYADLPTVKIWPDGKMPIEVKDASVEMPAEKMSEKGIVTFVSEPSIEIHLPTNTTKATMGFVICPGGAYGCLDHVKEGRKMAEYLNKIGVAAFVLKYRLRQYPRKASLADLQRTLSLVRSKSKEWNINPKFLGAMGFSAGGHLVTLSCAQGTNRVYQAVDDADKFSARPSFVALIYPAYLAEFKTHEIKPDIAPAITNFPPSFVISALDDRTYRGSSVRFVSEHILNTGWPKMEVHFFHSGGHGFALRSKPSWTTYRWERLLATWLRYTGDKMNAVIDVSDDKADYSIVECPDEELPLE